MTDLSVVVTAHNESTVAGPTMRSADLAVSMARARGFTVETLVALDAATSTTVAYFRQARFHHWELREFAEGDLGRVRNAVLPETQGDYVAFLDADDLFSENWLAEGLTLMADAGDDARRLIAHPELNVMFDGKLGVLQNIDQDSILFTPYHFYMRNYYDSLCLAPREAHLELPYVHRDLARGLSYQDYQFSIETMAHGYRHVVVRDTIIFKRRRDFSLLRESMFNSSMVRSLPEMAIGRVSDLGRPEAAASAAEEVRR
jgi:glycosyltransferase involved in cell wall biosynthesis